MIPSESAGCLFIHFTVYFEPQFLFDEVQIIKIFFMSHAFGVKSETLSLTFPQKFYSFSFYIQVYEPF